MILQCIELSLLVNKTNISGRRRLLRPPVERHNPAGLGEGRGVHAQAGPVRPRGDRLDGGVRHRRLLLQPVHRQVPEALRPRPRRAMAGDSRRRLHGTRRQDEGMSVHRSRFENDISH